MTSLNLRSATLSDVEAITALAIPIVTHDGFHDYFFPHQDEFPEDMYQWWLRYYRNFILKPYNEVLVLETNSKEIVGLAIWMYSPRGTGVSNSDDPKPKGLDLEKASYYERKYMPSCR